eukprot:m.235270 g.235270  ORF g.235270 m.235270 type:complete len:112 (+) comp19332_c0_seq13:361-696(+)
MVQHRVCTGRTTLSLSWLRIACHDTDAWFEDVIPRIQEHAALLQRLLQPTHASSSVPATDNSAILRSPVDEKQCMLHVPMMTAGANGTVSRTQPIVGDRRFEPTALDASAF